MRFLVEFVGKVFGGVCFFSVSRLSFFSSGFLGFCGVYDF